MTAAAAVADAVRCLRVPDAAEVLACSRDHVYDLIARGELRAVDIGHGRAKTRIRTDDLQAYIDRRTRATT